MIRKLKNKVTPISTFRLFDLSAKASLTIVSGSHHLARELRLIDAFIGLWVKNQTWKTATESEDGSSNAFEEFTACPWVSIITIWKSFAKSYCKKQNDLHSNKNTPRGGILVFLVPWDHVICKGNISKQCRIMGTVFQTFNRIMGIIVEYIVQNHRNLKILT